MSDLEKLIFPSLDVGGTNYIVWALEASNYLCADGLSDTIEDGFVLPTGNSPDDTETRKRAARAVCLLLRHVHKDFKFNYLEERDPASIWTCLRLRFDTDRKQAMLPLLIDEWNKLCFYNFKTVTEFTTKLYSIASELSRCGRKLSESEKIKKTLATFNPPERILSMQYRAMNHSTFDKLVAALLLDERHGVLLQRNHDERRLSHIAPVNPNGTPEANYGNVDGRSAKFKPSCGGEKRWKNNRDKRASGKGKSHQAKVPESKDTCHTCGLQGHWADKCRTSAFHCKLYQDSTRKGSKPPKGKSKSVPSKKVSFMTDFSDDSGAESNCVESYNNTFNGGENMYLIDSATTHFILRDNRFFVNLELHMLLTILKPLEAWSP